MIGEWPSRSNKITDTHLVTKLEFLKASVLSPVRQLRLAPIRERRRVTGVSRGSLLIRGVEVLDER
jgi:hypothetical protein